MTSPTPIVLVVGADGQLGRAIVERFRRDAIVHALNRRDLDITDAAAVDERGGAFVADADRQLRGVQRRGRRAAAAARGVRHQRAGPGHPGKSGA